MTAITLGTTHHTCAILNLELGPVNLTLLGLNVILDNCSNGPVTVTITAVTGHGNLLGNLLCELLGNGAISLGTTLQNIVNLITGLLGWLSRQRTKAAHSEATLCVGRLILASLPSVCPT